MLAPYDLTYLLNGLHRIDAGAELIYLPETASTNNLAKAAPSPLGIVIAEQQSQGRGRLGRSFFSPPGSGMYLSIFFHRDIPPSEAPLLPFATGVAVCETLAGLGVTAGLKWINDIMIHNKKAGGILCESRITDNGSLWVAGIGLNILEPPGGFPEDLKEVAVGVFGQNEKSIIPPHFRENLVLGITERLLDGVYNLDKSINKYKPYCISLGRPVEVIPLRGQPYLALAEDILPDGSLLVHSDGETIRLDTGEIRMIHIAES